MLSRVVTMRALKPFTSLIYSACARHHTTQQLTSAAVYLSTASARQHDSTSTWAWGATSAVSAAILGLASAVHAESVTVTTPSGQAIVLDVPQGNSWAVNVKPASDPTPKAPELAGPVQLLPPPYALNALEPFMSQETLEYHWGKHQRTYAENLNKQLSDAPKLSAALTKGGLEGLVEAAWNNGRPTAAFNNAAQVYNHQLFWASMKPGGGGKPSGALAEAIERDFGGLDALKAELRKAGTTQFGSGWAWLVADDEGNLQVLKTGNAVTPLVSGWVPLLTIDVWEHAYYIDFRNRRLDFINAFLEHLVDWEAAAARYADATK